MYRVYITETIGVCSFGLQGTRVAKVKRVALVIKCEFSSRFIRVTRVEAGNKGCSIKDEFSIRFIWVTV